MLSLQIREAVAVAAHQREEFEGVEVAGYVASGFGEGAEEPAKVEAIGPDWDVDLVSREEGYGGSDAVDRRAVSEVAFEIEAEAFLRASSYGDDDVLRAQAIEAFDECGVGYGAPAVDRGHVDVVFVDGNSLPFEPLQIAFCADGAGHDPDGVAGLADVRLFEEFAEVFEAGKTIDGRRLQAVPDEDHEGRVGDGEVGVEEGLAVVEAAVEVFKGGRGWDDEESSVAHDLDGRFGGAVEEVDAEDAMDLGRSGIRHAGVIFS
jgi:hypothetical protein